MHRAGDGETAAPRVVLRYVLTIRVGILPAILQRAPLDRVEKPDHVIALRRRHPGRGILSSVSRQSLRYSSALPLPQMLDDFEDVGLAFNRLVDGFHLLGGRDAEKIRPKNDFPADVESAVIAFKFAADGMADRPR